MYLVYIYDFLALNRRHKPFLSLLGDRSSYSYSFLIDGPKTGLKLVTGQARQAYCSYCVLPYEKKRLSTSLYMEEGT